MSRHLVLALGILFVFVVTCAIMVRFMPGPLNNSDYVVIGSVATLVAILVLFFGLVGTSSKGGETFFRRRKKR